MNDDDSLRDAHLLKGENRSQDDRETINQNRSVLRAPCGIYRCADAAHMV